MQKHNTINNIHITLHMNCKYHRVGSIDWMNIHVLQNLTRALSMDATYTLQMFAGDDSHWTSWDTAYKLELKAKT